jgi:hypothetical protein
MNRIYLIDSNTEDVHTAVPDGGVRTTDDHALAYSLSTGVRGWPGGGWRLEPRRVCSAGVSS